MTYDSGTGFSPTATFNAPLAEVAEDPLEPGLRRWNNVAGAVDYYEHHGVPRDKLVLGGPFYGQGFRVASAGERAGLYQPRSVRSRPAAGATSSVPCSPIRPGTATAIRWPARHGSTTPVPGRS
jgi:GH18 family chitinase